MKIIHVITLSFWLIFPEISGNFRKIFGNIKFSENSQPYTSDIAARRTWWWLEQCSRRWRAERRSRRSSPSGRALCAALPWGWSPRTGWWTVSRHRQQSPAASVALLRHINQLTGSLSPVTKPHCNKTSDSCSFVTAPSPRTAQLDKARSPYAFGMEACPLRKSQLKSLDFAVNNALKKICDTKSQDIVNECREIFNRLSAESTIASRRWKFMEKITVLQNKLYAAYLLSMTPKNFLRYDDRGGRTQLKWH